MFPRTELYQDEEFERLSNLTLVPTRCNSSLSDRPWEQKRSLFAALSTKTEDEAKAILKSMADAGVDVTEVGSKIYAGQYLPHVHTIGNVKGEWDLNAVNACGKELADLVWQRIAPWVGLQLKFNPPSLSRALRCPSSFPKLVGLVKANWIGQLAQPVPVNCPVSAASAAIKMNAIGLVLGAFAVGFAAGRLRSLRAFQRTHH